MHPEEGVKVRKTQFQNSSLKDTCEALKLKLQLFNFMRSEEFQNVLDPENDATEHQVSCTKNGIQYGLCKLFLFFFFFLRSPLFTFCYPRLLQFS